jgi:hypothetical protein
MYKELIVLVQLREATRHEAAARRRSGSQEREGVVGIELGIDGSTDGADQVKLDTTLNQEASTVTTALLAATYKQSALGITFTSASELDTK